MDNARDNSFESFKNIEFKKFLDQLKEIEKQLTLLNKDSIFEKALIDENKELHDKIDEIHNFYNKNKNIGSELKKIKDDLKNVSKMFDNLTDTVHQSSNNVKPEKIDKALDEGPSIENYFQRLILLFDDYLIEYYLILNEDFQKKKRYETFREDIIEFCKTLLSKKKINIPIKNDSKEPTANKSITLDDICNQNRSFEIGKICNAYFLVYDFIENRDLHILKLIWDKFDEYIYKYHNISKEHTKSRIMQYSFIYSKDFSELLTIKKKLKNFLRIKKRNPKNPKNPKAPKAPNIPNQMLLITQKNIIITSSFMIIFLILILFLFGLAKYYDFNIFFQNKTETNSSQKIEEVEMDTTESNPKKLSSVEEGVRFQQSNPEPDKQKFTKELFKMMGVDTNTAHIELECIKNSLEKDINKTTQNIYIINCQINRRNHITIRTFYIDKLKNKHYWIKDTQNFELRSKAIWLQIYAEIDHIDSEIGSISYDAFYKRFKTNIINIMYNDAELTKPTSIDLIDKPSKEYAKKIIDNALKESWD